MIELSKDIRITGEKMKKKTILLFVLLFAQPEFIKAEFVSQHMGLSLSQLLSIVPTQLLVDRKDNIYYIHNYPINDCISLFFMDSQKGINHWAIFVQANDIQKLRILYNYFVDSFMRLYGNYEDSEYSVFFNNNMPRKVSRLELSKPDIEIDNHNSILIRWYGF